MQTQVRSPQNLKPDHDIDCRSTVKASAVIQLFLSSYKALICLSKHTPKLGVPNSNMAKTQHEN